jgi:putative transposase
MSSTYYTLHYHWVCSIKERRPLIRAPWRSQFHEYLGGTIRGLAGMPLKIGGVEDHVHALIGLKPVHCIADFIRELKKATSVWASAHHEPEFQWQEGYSIFSVSTSMMAVVSQYIERQEEHYRKQDFLQELKALLEKHGVQYDPKYLPGNEKMFAQAEA